VPRIVEYPELLGAMHALQLRSLYYNSGAFGFEPAVDAKSVGWICAEDSSLRPEARQLAQLVPTPAARELPGLLTRAVTELLYGPIWVMPKSHWAFELDFGSKAWMPQALGEVGVDASLLEQRTTGDAIEFGADEVPLLTSFVTQLMTNLTGSDFALAAPGKPIVCTLHHHKQVWWTTTDLALLQSLQQLPGPSGV
jgi:hypothetical protein